MFSCVVIESSFDPGERLQAPGSLCFFLFVDHGPQIYNKKQTNKDLKSYGSAARSSSDNDTDMNVFGDSC